MRVVCAIGQRGGPDLIRAVMALIAPGSDLLLLHVVDLRPHRELDRLASPLRHGPVGGPGRDAALGAAEDDAARATLAEALAVARLAGVSATTRLERGRPEQVIVEVAREVRAPLTAITARENVADHPRHGPASLGHTARFVLDHAEGDVLLVRT